MPLVWNKSLYDEFYQGRIGWADPDDPLNVNGERIGEVLHYGKDFARYFSRGDLDFWHYRCIVRTIVNKLNLISTQRILDIGCGFGFLISCFKTANIDQEVGVDFPLSYGIDSSEWIEDNFSEQNISDIDAIFMEFSKTNTRNVDTALINMCGYSNFHVIINSIVNVINNNQILRKELDLLEGKLIGGDNKYIINIIDNDIMGGEVETDLESETLQKYNMKMKSLEDWSLLRPSHSWFGVRSHRMIVGI